MSDEARVGLIMRLFEAEDKTKSALVRFLVRGIETVLGEVADANELFLGEDGGEVALSEIAGRITNT